MMAVAYGTLVVVDGFFVLISLVNLVGCGTVTAIAMRRRMRWRQAARGATDAVALGR